AVLDVIRLGVPEVGQDQLGNADVAAGPWGPHGGRRRGVMATGQPFGDDPPILGPALGGIPRAEVVGPALDDDHGLAGGLVEAIGRDTFGSAHAVSSSVQVSKLLTKGGLGTALPTAERYA